MERHRLARPGQLDLVFEGEKLADVHSKDDDDQQRWTEIRIYRTNTGKYITEVVGRTVLPTERDRVAVTVGETAGEVIEGLKRTRSDGLRYITKLGLEALDEAAERDPSLAPNIVEHV